MLVPVSLKDKREVPANESRASIEAASKTEIIV
jgi:hypothetical protein